LIGLFVGPVIMAALLTVWREWLSTMPSGQYGESSVMIWGAQIELADQIG
jgi:predicted PurR-regulated permease PerM